MIQFSKSGLVVLSFILTAMTVVAGLGVRHYLTSGTELPAGEQIGITAVGSGDDPIGVPPAGEPHQVVQAFFEAAAVAHDYERAKGYWEDHVEMLAFSPLDRMPLSQFITALMGVGEQGYRTLSFATTHRNSGNATVEVRGSDGQGIGLIGGCFSLAQIDGEWKIIGPGVDRPSREELPVS